MKKDIPQHVRDNPEKFIPKGFYCHGRIKPELELCPFWDCDNTKLEQDNGYCHYLKQGDWEMDWISLLWDMCKECDINL